MTRPVIVIGGGLTGLSAAAELARQNIPYRLIEVKRRVGGSLGSRQQDGFVLEPILARFSEQFLPVLRAYGFDDEAFYAREDGLYAFRQGIQVLIDYLAAQTASNTLLRMAASSLGGIPGHYELCMENGMVFDASALIVAAPARFAERMFRTLLPDLSLRLFEAEYEPFAHCLMGCPRGSISAADILPDNILALNVETDALHVPDDAVLVRAITRVEPAQFSPDSVLTQVKTMCELRGEPLVQSVMFWPEAHLRGRNLPAHTAFIADLHRMLPPGLALVGSDYGAHTPELQITHGRDAARQIIAGL